MSGASGKSESKNGFDVPKWAGKPPSGLHLDVMKDEKMIQKLMIDEKNCYFFGRNKDSCDFVTDHASCSRVHAVLLWHKHLNRSFLIDLNSAHGTFIGTLRLEANKPQQMFVDTEFKFGASTRTYVLRERPQMNKNFPSILQAGSSGLNESLTDQENVNNESLNASTLPESEAELENLTEFNTAHNKRIAQLVVADLNSAGGGAVGGMPVQVKRKKKSVVFMEDVEIINPEDIDPSIGRFRNMISTTVVIPNKKKRPNIPGVYESQMVLDKRVRLSDKLHDSSSEYSHGDEQSFTLYDEDDNYEFPNEYGYSNLGIRKLDLAPDVDQSKSEEGISAGGGGGEYSSLLNKQVHDSLSLQSQQHQDAVSQFDKRKKYVKEAWPGRESATHAVALATTSNKMSSSVSDTLESTRQSSAVHIPSSAPFIPEKPATATTTNSQAGSSHQGQQPSKRLII